MIQCLDCKKEVLEGRARCADHLESIRIAANQYYLNNREAVNAKRREQYRTDEQYRNRAKIYSKNRSPEYHREQNLKRQHGMTIGEWETMYLFQGQRCALCFTNTPGGKGRFHVDHSHFTTKIRGLLCHWCNTSLERAEIDGWLSRARSYINEGGLV